MNPSLGATLTPVQRLGLQFYALYSEGYRPPSLRESIGNDSLLQPNPNLKPEISKDWEFGINYLKDGALFKRDKVRVKAAYFINNYDDYISRVQNTTSVAFFHDRKSEKGQVLRSRILRSLRCKNLLRGGLADRVYRPQVLPDHSNMLVQCAGQRLCLE